MKILFIGGTKRGYLTLKALLENQMQVVGIISLLQHKHEKERFEKQINDISISYKIPCYETTWMKERDYSEIIKKEFEPDIAFVVGCRIIIQKEIFSIPPLGTLAVHDSLLPNYRGFAPLNWAIINGEDHTGVTLFYLSDLMDAGDIVARKPVPIGPDETAPEIYEKVCQATIDLILEYSPLLSQGKAPRIKQNYKNGSFTCSRSPEDGLIDWNKTTREIYDKIRALAYPYPGSFTYYEGKQIFICKAKIVKDPPFYVGSIPGRVVTISKSDGYIDVITGDGILRILEVQLQGKKMNLASNVVKSVRRSLGLRVDELLERIRTLEKHCKIYEK